MAKQCLECEHGRNEAEVNCDINGWVGCGGHKHNDIDCEDFEPRKGCNDDGWTFVKEVLKKAENGVAFCEEGVKMGDTGYMGRSDAYQDICDFIDAELKQRGVK